MTVPFDLATLDTIRKTETRLPPSRRERLWEAAGHRCHWCGCTTLLCLDQRADQATVDHVIPEYKGGTNDENNVVSACFACNQRRNHEDACRMPEGHLLGKRWSPKPMLTPAAVKAQPAPVPPAIVKLKTPASEVMSLQRDQALKEIVKLRAENAGLRDRLNEEMQGRQRLKDRLDTLTFRQFLLMKIKGILESNGSRQD